MGGWVGFGAGGGRRGDGGGGVGGDGEVGLLAGVLRMWALGGG